MKKLIFTSLMFLAGFTVFAQMPNTDAPRGNGIDTVYGPYKWDGNTQVSLKVEVGFDEKLKKDVPKFSLIIESFHSGDFDGKVEDSKTTEFTKEEVKKTIDFLDSRFKDGVPKKNEKMYLRDDVYFNISTSSDGYVEITIDPKDPETIFRVEASDVSRAVHVLELLYKRM